MKQSADSALAASARAALGILATFVLLLTAALSTHAAPPKVSGMSYNGLVKCGGQTVYVGFDDGDGYGCGGTVSPDGRYALGWTMMPALGVKPVDWSKWTLRNDGFYELFPYDDLGKGSPPYRSVDCMVDLKTNRIFDLHVDGPYAPEETHGDVRCAWSDPQKGPEYSLIAVDGKWFTQHLFLVRFDQDGMHQTELTDELNKALVPIIRDKRPLENARDFNTLFGVWGNESNDKKAPAPLVTFRGTQAEIPFVADIMHSGWADDLNLEIDGTIAVHLPEGKVIHVSSTTPRDDPFEDDPALVEADRKMNQTYAKLLQQLGPTEREVIRKDQLGWIEGRESDAHDGVSGKDDPGGKNLRDVRNQSYLKSTRERTQQLEDWMKDIRERGRDAVHDIILELKQSDS